MVNLNLPQETLDKLKWMVNNPENTLCFLGFTLNLSTGDLQDVLQQKVTSPQVKDGTMYSQIAELLIKYASTSKPVKVGKLVNFKDFSGGYAYENAFHRRVVEPIVKLFGKAPQNLIKAAMSIGGKQLEYGDCSIEIETFPEISLTIILWVDDELPSTANVLFDESSGKTFNAEDLAWLSDLTLWRLSIAQTLAV
ncbi:MAG: DUF3786 domain-containing protein [Nitrososphaerota archaeon]|jgi:hypothetical protein|nr:DUF3786 domain-containing protein [Nitrososphaerota archaeon]